MTQKSEMDETEKMLDICGQLLHSASAIVAAVNKYKTECDLLKKEIGMKLLLLIACLLLVACGYDGRGTQCDQYSVWANKAECFRDYSKELEKEIEILKVKMEYGCKELKEDGK